MRKGGPRRHSIFSRHFHILIVSVTILFLGGIGMLLLNSRHSWKYIHQLLESNLEISVTQIEDQINAVEQISYNIITNTELQTAGSSLLAYFDDKSAHTPYEKSLAVNELTAAIRTQIEGHNNILCANYVSPEGVQHTIANTLYIRPEGPLLEAIEQAAQEKEGSAAFLYFTNEKGYEDYLIVARQIREKQNQTLRDMGVVYLIADMRRITELYRRSNGYGLIIENSAGEALYEFMETLDTGLSGEEVASMNWKDALPSYGGEHFAAATLSSGRSGYRYQVVSSITAVYRNFTGSIVLIAALYSAVVLAILLTATLSVKNVTGQLMKLVGYIQTMPVSPGRARPGKQVALPCPQPLNDIDIDEVLALKRAYDDMLQRINGLVQRNYTQMLMVKEAEIAALQAQFNPHFLYNTLNSVYWMAKTAGNGEIMEVSRSLSILTREAINNKDHVVSLEKELEILTNYITIQNHRYSDRFTLEIQVRTAQMDNAVPKFTLQPLLENAFTHGVENMLEPCRILVSVYDDGNKLVCEVANTGPSIDEAIMHKLKNNTAKTGGTGVGLMNIDARIKSLFGAQYGIAVFNDPLRGAVVQAVLRRVAVGSFSPQLQEEGHEQ